MDHRKQRGCMRELQITTEDLREKTGTHKILRDKCTILRIKFNEQRLGRVISNVEKKLDLKEWRSTWPTKNYEQKKPYLMIMTKVIN